MTRADNRDHYLALFSNVSTGYNNQISCFFNAVDLKTMKMLADVLPENCFASKDIMLKLLNLLQKLLWNTYDTKFWREKILAKQFTPKIDR